MRKYIVVLLSLLFLSFLANPVYVKAGCSGFSLGCCNNCGGCSGIGPGQCRVNGSTVTQSDSCSPGGGYCSTFYTCDSGAEAHAICGTGATGCSGTCTNGACGSNGSGDCHDFNGDLNRCRSIPGCYEDYGQCSGRYCKVGANPLDCHEMGDQNCRDFGCSYTPAYNSCAVSSPCSNGACLNDCGIATQCSSPTGTIQGYKVLMPGNQNIAPAAGQTVSLDGGSPTTANPYFFTNVSASAHTVSISVPSGYSAGYTLCYNSTGCHTGTPTTGSSVSVTVPANGYADLWWHFTPPPPTCTVSLSTSTPTISVGSTALVTANVTTTPAGTTISGIDWLSSNTTVGTIFAHTVQDIVSNNVLGKAAGTTNISATVNLAPTGSCQTNGLNGNGNPIPITVYPRSWWQVTGGDVYVGGGNVVSSIPSTCTQNCYINLAN